MVHVEPKVARGNLHFELPTEPYVVHGTKVSTTEGFEQLAEEWGVLFERAGTDNAFLTFEWMHTWWKHWGAKRNLAILLVRDRNECLVGLAPLSITRAASNPLFARRLSFIADDHAGSDYLNLLVAPGYEEPVIGELCKLIAEHRREWDYIELSDTANEPVLENFCARLQDELGLLSFSSPASVCYHIPLPATFEEYLRSISENTRSNFRRRSRAIQREGETEFHTLTEPADLEQNFGLLLELHRMRFEYKGGKSSFLDTGVPAFHIDALKALAARGWARLFLLRVGRQTVAALYGFSIGRQFQFYQCGMHTDWLRFGVGQLLMGNTIAAAIRSGLNDFDFLRGGEAYKLRWAEQSRQTTTVRLFGREPAGLRALTIFKSRTLMRRVKRLIRSGLNATINAVRRSPMAMQKTAERGKA